MQTFKIPDFIQFQSPKNQFLFSEPVRPLHFSGYYSAIQRATVLQLYYVVDQPKVGEGHI